MIINSNTDTTSKQQFLASNVFFLSKEINSIYNWYNLEQVLQDDAVIASLLGVFELRYWVSFSRGKENRAFYEEVPHIQRCFNVCFKIKKKKNKMLQIWSYVSGFFRSDVIAKTTACRGKLRCSAAKMYQSCAVILYARQWLKKRSLYILWAACRFHVPINYSFSSWKC